MLWIAVEEAGARLGFGDVAAFIAAACAPTPAACHGQDDDGASPQGFDEDRDLSRWPEALPFDVVPGPLMVGLFAWLPFRQVAASKEQLEQHCNAVTLISRPHPATTLRALELIKRVSSSAVTGVGGRAHTVNIIGTTLVAESLAAISRLPALTDLSVALPSLPRAERPLDTPGHATFFAAVAKLTRLRRLSVETQAIDADAIVRNCPHLTALLLPMTGGLDLAPIIQLPALATLQFPAKHINGHASSLEALRGSTTLTCLDLTGCSVLDAALDVLPAITSLRTLKIVRSRSVTAAAVPHITACRALEALDVSASVGLVPGLKSLAVPTLRSLRAVALLRVDNHVPGVAAGCPALEELNVSSSSCGLQTIEALRACPSLRVLSMSQAEVNDDGLIACLNLRQLQKIDVGYNGVTDAGVAAIAAHPTLTDLSLAHNRLVTEEGVNDLKRCRGLRVLNVAQCDVQPGLKARGIVGPNVSLLGTTD